VREKDLSSGNLRAKNLLGYYQAFPKSFNQINRRIGYRVRPSMIWSYEDSSHLGLITASPTMASRVFRACCE